MWRWTVEILGDTINPRRGNDDSWGNRGYPELARSLFEKEMPNQNAFMDGTGNHVVCMDLKDGIQTDVDESEFGGAIMDLNPDL